MIIAFKGIRLIIRYVRLEFVYIKLISDAQIKITRQQNKYKVGRTLRTQNSKRCAKYGYGNIYLGKKILSSSNN